MLYGNWLKFGLPFRAMFCLEKRKLSNGENRKSWLDLEGIESKTTIKMILNSILTCCLKFSWAQAVYNMMNMMFGGHTVYSAFKAVRFRTDNSAHSCMHNDYAFNEFRRRYMKQISGVDFWYSQRSNQRREGIFKYAKMTCVSHKRRRETPFEESTDSGW